MVKISFSWISPLPSVHEEIDESETTLMMWGYGWNGPSMGLMMFGSILLIVVLVVLGLAVMRKLNRRTTSPTGRIHTPAGNGPTAVEILNQRYARGEIDAATFEQMRERLERAEDVPQRSRADGHRPVGESLFDGTLQRGSDIL